MPRLKSAPDFNWKLGHTMIRGTSDIFTLLQIHLSPSLSHVYQQQNFPALTISSSGLGTFCPATKRPRAYIVPGRYMSWDALSWDKMSPDLFSTSTQGLISHRPTAHDIFWAWNTGCWFTFLLTRPKLLIRRTFEQIVLTNLSFSPWFSLRNQSSIARALLYNFAQIAVQFRALCSQQPRQQCLTIAYQLNPWLQTVAAHERTNEFTRGAFSLVKLFSLL